MLKNVPKVSIQMKSFLFNATLLTFAVSHHESQLMKFWEAYEAHSCLRAVAPATRSSVERMFQVIYVFPCLAVFAHRSLS